MLIAQTGSNAPSPVAETEGNTPVSNLWWMLPLAAAIFALAWYLRPRKTVSQPPAKSSRSPGHKSSVRTRDAVSEPQLHESLPGDQQPTSTTRNTGSKKKKSSKNKKKNASINKPTQSPSVLAAVAEVTVAKVGKATVSTPTLASQIVSTLAKEVPEPKPVNAIFEPLRDAVKERRKSQYVEDYDDADSSSKQREPDLVQQLFGGKFERIVPRASIRSHADRWPAPAAQQVKNKETTASRPQPVEAAKPEPVSVPDTPEPAKGLKSFVSKVVKSDALIE